MSKKTEEEIISLSLLKAVDIPHAVQEMSLVDHSSSKYLVSVSSDQTIAVFNLETNEIECTYDTGGQYSFFYSCLYLEKQKKLLVTVWGAYLEILDFCSVDGKLSLRLFKRITLANMVNKFYPLVQKPGENLLITSSSGSSGNRLGDVLSIRFDDNFTDLLETTLIQGVRRYTRTFGHIVFSILNPDVMYLGYCHSTGWKRPKETSIIKFDFKAKRRERIKEIAPSNEDLSSMCITCVDEKHEFLFALTRLSGLLVFRNEVLYRVVNDKNCFIGNATPLVCVEPRRILIGATNLFSLQVLGESVDNDLEKKNFDFVITKLTELKKPFRIDTMLLDEFESRLYTGGMYEKSVLLFEIKGIQKKIRLSLKAKELEASETSQVDEEEFDEVDHIHRTREALRGISNESINVIEKIGSGVYGAAFKCRINWKGLENDDFVIKIITNAFLQSENIRNMGNRDHLEIPYHKNVVHILGNIPRFKFSKSRLLSLPGVNKGYRVQISSLGEQINRPAVVMKYYECDLDTYVKRKANLSPLDICSILGDIVNGAKHLNENKIVHLDIHVGNVFMQKKPNGQYIALLGDFGASLDLRKNLFGLCVPMKDWQRFSFFSRSSATLSSIEGVGRRHLAPEIALFFETDDEKIHEDILDKGKFDCSKCDIYSIGVLGEELMKKFNGKNEHKMLIKNLLERMVEESRVKRIGFSELEMKIEGFQKLII